MTSGGQLCTCPGPFSEAVPDSAEAPAFRTAGPWAGQAQRAVKTLVPWEPLPCLLHLPVSTADTHSTPHRPDISLLSPTDKPVTQSPTGQVPTEQEHGCPEALSPQLCSENVCSPFRRQRRCPLMEVPPLTHTQQSEGT